MYKSSIATIILAGGKGTRMNSDLPKVLHKVGGQPIVNHILNQLEQLKLGQIYVVIGHKKELVKSKLGTKWQYVTQEQPLGTGDAVKTALNILDGQPETIVVFNGDDSAFYTKKTIQKILKSHHESNSKMTILTAIKENVDISGRVMRDSQGKIVEIKANSKMSPEELREHNELVCGFYLFDGKWLEEQLHKVEPSKNGEYNITKLIDFALKENNLLDITLADPHEWQSINTKRELAKARRLWRKHVRN